MEWYHRALGASGGFKQGGNILLMFQVTECCVQNSLWKDRVEAATSVRMLSHSLEKRQSSSTHSLQPLCVCVGGEKGVRRAHMRTHPLLHTPNFWWFECGVWEKTRHINGSKVSGLSNYHIRLTDSMYKGQLEQNWGKGSESSVSDTLLVSCRNPSGAVEEAVGYVESWVSVPPVSPLW